MLSAAEIRDASFTKAMSGYKKEEVDQLLEQIEQDYRQFAKMAAEYEAKIKALQEEKESLKASSDSIQIVLLNAQKLADQMVAEAKKKSEETLQRAQTNIEVLTAQEKELAAVFEMKANERKATLEKELTDMIRDAKGKAAAMQTAAENAVHRQQLLYEKLQMEMSAFRTTITAKYREHLELLKELPETAPVDPAKMAELVSNAYERVPEPESFLAEKKENGEPQDIRSDSGAEEPQTPPETGGATIEGFKVSL